MPACGNKFIKDGMKKIIFNSVLIALALSLLLPARTARAAGKTYYVATNGKDSNAGTQAAPWRTIQKAANVAAAGDTVYVRGGTYHEKVIVKNSGAAGNYITFSSYPGETAVVDVRDIKMENYHEGGFTVNQKSYVQIVGFRIVNSNSTDNGGFGIVCVQSDHCNVKNNQTYNTYRSGIMIRSSSNVIVEGNDVELANHDGNQEMLAISGSEFVTVLNNRVHDGGSGAQGGEGISVYYGSRDVLVKGNEVFRGPRVGIYVDAYQGNGYNITIDGNFVHENQRSGISIEAEKRGYGLNNIVVVNNIVYKNATSGILLGNWGYGALNNIFIVNNTVVQNGSEGGGGIGLWNNRAKNVVVRNNLLSQNTQFTIQINGTPPSETTITNNLLDGFRNLSGETRGTNYVTGAPRFVNVSASDFRLDAASPAINAGTDANAPKRDFADAPRPNDSKWDIGAYEFSGTAVTPAVVFSDNFNAAFKGWTKTGKVVWSAAAPRIGPRSVRLAGNASISRVVSTQGYENLKLTVYLGAASYENKETLQLSWWDGSAWKPLMTIKNGSPRENGKLNRLTFILPAAAANRADFKIRIRQSGADAADYGYVDSIQLTGTPIP